MSVTAPITLALAWLDRASAVRCRVSGSSSLPSTSTIAQDAGHGPDRLGPVGGRVAEPVRVRPAQRREPGPQRLGGHRGVLHRDTGQQQIGHPARVGHLDRARAGPGLGQDGVARRLAQHGGQHGQAGLADQHDLIAAFREPVAFRLDARDQWAGHVDDVEAAFRGLLAQLRRRAVGRDQHGASVRYIGQGRGEDGAGLLQLSAVLRGAP